MAEQKAAHNKKFEKELAFLHKNSYEAYIHQCYMTVKEIPDPMEGTALDPRVYQSVQKYLKMAPPDWEQLAGEQNSEADTQAADEAGDTPQFGEVINEDVTETEIQTENCTLTGPNGEIPVRIYTAKQDSQESNSKEQTPQEQRPCIIYFHGGGYVSGSMDVVENFCKLLCEKAEAVVVNVDYHLAPKYKYPVAVYDVDYVVQWVWEHADGLGIDRSFIVTAGDSAGGTLAIDCCMLDHNRFMLGETKEKKIFGQLLFYPAVTMTKHAVGRFAWNKEDYGLTKKDEAAEFAITEIENFVHCLPRLYMGVDGRVDKPFAAPLYMENCSGFPPTFMALAEFDYLRLSSEYFAMKLQEQGVDCAVLLYKGMNHAFIDKIGQFPQAYDLAVEAAEWMKKTKNDSDLNKKPL